MKNIRKTGVEELLVAMAPYLLESGIDFPIFCEIAKLSYALAASKSARFRNGRPNHALISAETGINRRELRQILEPSPADPSQTSKRTLAEKIQKLWNEDRKFVSKKNTPRRLRINDETNGFAALARVVASDLPPSAILSYAKKKKIAHCSRGHAQLFPSVKTFNKKRPPNPVQELIGQTGMLLKLAQFPENLLRTNRRTTVLRSGTQSEARYLLKEADESARRTIDGLASTQTRPANRKNKKNRYSVNITVITTLNKVDE